MDNVEKTLPEKLSTEVIHIVDSNILVIHLACAEPELFEHANMIDKWRVAGKIIEQSTTC